MRGQALCEGEEEEGGALWGRLLSPLSSIGETTREGWASGRERNVRMDEGWGGM